MRELCDQCATSIFNGHVFCMYCGFTVCLDCFDLRSRNEPLRGKLNSFKNPTKMLKLLKPSI